MSRSSPRTRRNVRWSSEMSWGNSEALAPDGSNVTANSKVLGLRARPPIRYTLRSVRSQSGAVGVGRSPRRSLRTVRSPFRELVWAGRW